ncbi:rod shape-determining protein MreC [Desulforhopalus singaporensis]|uniref:Cell shape-determining protein MreC n=1 Tax=Desulforhopalus singaporensis TaxID=91360 RepID=A0A1H0R709_9BACT|nr:rod shape-determining protein MreC [Desulforhopalus singaporensis]SDP25291.1 rod shape-determining protein MreC [Desulforhopalus singaporensis]
MRKKTKTNKGRSLIATIRISLLILILAMVVLLLLASMLGGRFGTPHQLTLDAIGPLQSIVTRSVTGLIELKHDYLDLLNVRDENKRLQQLVDKYLEQLGTYREGYVRYLHFEELLEFKKKSNFKPVSARVVGKEPGFWYQTIIVDRGRKDDILEGMIVLSPAGVVGQIIHTSENYSKVLLANAPSSAIDAMIQKNRTRGILKGTGENGYILQYVLKNADVAIGDYIVTAGIGGIFPAGIPLGRVSEIHRKRRGMFQEIEVRPLVDFQKLEYVFIDPTDRRKILESMNLSTER